MKNFAIFRNLILYFNLIILYHLLLWKNLRKNKLLTLPELLRNIRPQAKYVMVRLIPYRCAQSIDQKSSSRIQDL